MNYSAAVKSSDSSSKEQTEVEVIEIEPNKEGDGYESQETNSAS
ncbi:hypothetical protein [Candidatus Nitrosocosmicus hydrocola]|nr:hypothetical protein [Candidatus Nitrosocosmicus hydrocola]